MSKKFLEIKFAWEPESSNIRHDLCDFWLSYALTTVIASMIYLLSQLELCVVTVLIGAAEFVDSRCLLPPSCDSAEARWSNVLCFICTPCNFPMSIYLKNEFLIVGNLNKAWPYEFQRFFADIERARNFGQWIKCSSLLMIKWLHFNLTDATQAVWRSVFEEEWRSALETGRFDLPVNSSIWLRCVMKSRSCLNVDDSEVVNEFCHIVMISSLFT